MYRKLRGSLCSLPNAPLRMYRVQPPRLVQPGCLRAGRKGSALPRCSSSHVGALAPDFTRLGLPRTKIAFPSSTPFPLLVLIIANPSFLVLFLLPSAYLHLPPAPHPRGNPTTLAFFSASQPISTSPLPLLQVPLQTLPSHPVPLSWLPSPTPPLPQTRPPS